MLSFVYHWRNSYIIHRASLMDIPNKTQLKDSVKVLLVLSFYQVVQFSHVMGVIAR